MNTIPLPFWLLCAAAAVLYAAFYPSQFLIADEVSYFNQAWAWAQGWLFIQQAMPCEGALSVLPGNYPAGTGLLAAGAIKVGGVKAVFGSTLTLWLAGTVCLAAALRRPGKSWCWAFYPWFFLPALVMTRTLMSDVPSFALAAFFLWLFLRSRQGVSWALAAGFVGGLGLCFRETNLIWALPFLAGATLRNYPSRWFLWLGFGLGVAPRLVSGYALLGHPLFFRDPGVVFSLEFLGQNILVYTASLLVLLPGGLWFLKKSRWEFCRETVVMTVVFFAIFGTYGYDALAKSGWKALVLQGRFLLPFLPALAVAAAHAETPVHSWLERRRTVVASGAVLCFGVVQFFGWRYNQMQSRITDALYALPGKSISFTPDEARKFVNAFHGPASMIDGTGLVAGDLQCDSVWYVHTIARGESLDRKTKANACRMAIERLFRKTLPEPVSDISLVDGARLQIWRFQFK